PPSVASRRSARRAGPSAFHRLRIVRAQDGVRPTWAAASVGDGGASGRVRSQISCQWVFSRPSRQARERRGGSSCVRWGGAGRRGGGEGGGPPACPRPPWLNTHSYSA